MECREEFEQLLTPYLFAKNCFAAAILAMKVERMLAQVNPNERCVLHDLPLQRENLLQRNPLVGWG